MKSLTAVVLLLALAGCSNDGVPGEDIAKGVHPETYGVQLPEYKLMDRDLKLHWLQEYVTGYSVPSDGDAPASIRPIALASGCALPKPVAGALLAQVVTGHGNGRSSFYAMDAKDVDDMGRQLAAMVRGNRNPSIMLSKTDGRLSRIDVVVTESSKPVHLVLASRTGALWNVQAAAGARLSGVTLISETSMAAVANLPQGVPMVALTGAAAKQCGAMPAVEPVQEYPGLKMQIFKAAEPEKALSKANAAWAAYNRFFTKTFGQNMGEVSVGTNALYHAAIGPAPAKPEDRVAYRGLAGATLYVTPAALAFYGSEGAYAKARRDAAIQAASRLTGGNFQTAMDQAGY